MPLDDRWTRHGMNVPRFAFPQARGRLTRVGTGDRAGAPRGHIRRTPGTAAARTMP